MRRLALLALLALMLGSIATGCATAPDDADPVGDGLHLIVPSVAGLDESAAAEALSDAGYRIGEVTFEEAQGAEPGTVIKQDPIAGMSVPRDSEIDLVIAEP